VGDVNTSLHVEIDNPFSANPLQKEKGEEKKQIGDFEPQTFLEPEPNRPFAGLPYLHNSGWAAT
jgi:hypothetical protein